MLRSPPWAMERRGSDGVGGDGYIHAYVHRERLAPEAPRARELPSHESPSNEDVESTSAKSASLRGPAKLEKKWFMVLHLNAFFSSVFLSLCWLWVMPFGNSRPKPSLQFGESGRSTSEVSVCRYTKRGDTQRRNPFYLRRIGSLNSEHSRRHGLRMQPCLSPYDDHRRSESPRRDVPCGPLL